MAKSFDIAKFGNEKIKELENEFKKTLSSKGKSMKKKSKKNKPNKNLETSSPDTMTKRDFETFEQGIQRLKEYERELDSLDTTGFSVEAASIKSKLKDVSYLPQIAKEMKMLRLKIKEKESGVQKRSENIDYDVDVLVDTDFNNFLSGVKTTVAQKMKNREREIEELLHHDLLKREKKYREKHLSLMNESNEKKKKLEKEYADKYKLDVKIRLQKEVEEKFDKLLKDERVRLEDEKRKVEKERKRISEEAEKIKIARDNIRKEIEEKYKKKIVEHEEEMKKKLSQVLGAG